MMAAKLMAELPVTALPFIGISSAAPTHGCQKPGVLLLLDQMWWIQQVIPFVPFRVLVKPQAIQMSHLGGIKAYQKFSSHRTNVSPADSQQLTAMEFSPFSIKKADAG